jgi:hypothetical protein
VINPRLRFIAVLAGLAACGGAVGLAACGGGQWPLAEQ